MINKWSDPTYHALECMRELSAAETHLTQYISNKEDNNELRVIMDKIRDIRKRIEGDLLG